MRFMASLLLLFEGTSVNTHELAVMSNGNRAVKYYNQSEITAHLLSSCLCKSMRMLQNAVLMNECERKGMSRNQAQKKFFAA